MPISGKANKNALCLMTKTIYPINETITPICEPEIRLAKVEKGILPASLMV